MSVIHLKRKLFTCTIQIQNQNLLTLLDPMYILSTLKNFFDPRRQCKQLQIEKPSRIEVYMPIH